MAKERSKRFEQLPYFTFIIYCHDVKGNHCLGVAKLNVLIYPVSTEFKRELLIGIVKITVNASQMWYGFVGFGLVWAFLQQF